MKEFYKDSTSISVATFIQDSSSTTGAGLTGLVFNTASLTCYYVRPGSSAVAVTLATLAAANSAWSSGGFKEVDATNMPGVYRFDIPDAALATGVDTVVFLFKGATDMAPLPLEVLLKDDFRIRKNKALSNFEFLMIDSADHISAKTGLTVTATRSIDGAAFASCTNAPTELSNGIYKINLSAADMNGSVISLRFTATGADDRFVTIVTATP